MSSRNFVLWHNCPFQFKLVCSKIYSSLYTPILLSLLNNNNNKPPKTHYSNCALGLLLQSWVINNNNNKNTKIFVPKLESTAC